MIDKASLTIDRHTPIIPESIWCGVSPSQARTFTKIKNKLFLPYSGIEEITRWRGVPGNSYPKQDPFVITNQMLAVAEQAMEQSKGKLSDVQFYLDDRKISSEAISRFKICSTAKLVSILDIDTVVNLNLRIPNKFRQLVSSPDIKGISIPYFFEDKFCGFATRIIGEPLIKYAFSLPNRLCFGVDFSKDEVYIVEGVFDAMAMILHGFNAIGMGDSQPNYFKMFHAARFPKINLLFDNDYAGWLGAIKAYLILTQILEVDEERISILSTQQKDPELALLESFVVSKHTFSEALSIVKNLGSNLTTDDFRIEVKNE